MYRRFLSVFSMALVVLVSSGFQFGRPYQQTPVYKDPTRSVADRVTDLMSQMTLDEKIGQMTLVEKGSIHQSDIAAMGIGGLLSGGGGYPTPNNAQSWAAMVDGFQKQALTSRLGIPE